MTSKVWSAINEVRRKCKRMDKKVSDLENELNDEHQSGCRRCKCNTCITMEAVGILANIVFMVLLVLIYIKHFH